MIFDEDRIPAEPIDYDPEVLTSAFELLEYYQVTDLERCKNVVRGFAKYGWDSRYLWSVANGLVSIDRKHNSMVDNQPTTA